MKDTDTPVRAQRIALHKTINEIYNLDNANVENSAIVTGWILVAAGRHSQDEYSFKVFSSDTMADGDIEPWTGEGWLRYAAAHYEELTQVDDEDNEDDEGEDR